MPLTLIFFLLIPRDGEKKKEKREKNDTRKNTKILVDTP